MFVLPQYNERVRTRMEVTEYNTTSNAIVKIKGIHSLLLELMLYTNSNAAINVFSSETGLSGEFPPLDELCNIFGQEKLINELLHHGGVKSEVIRQNAWAMLIILCAYKDPSLLKLCSRYICELTDEQFVSLMNRSYFYNGKDSANVFEVLMDFGANGLGDVNIGIVAELLTVKQSHLSALMKCDFGSYALLSDCREIAFINIIMQNALLVRHAIEVNKQEEVQPLIERLYQVRLDNLTPFQDNIKPSSLQGAGLAQCLAERLSCQEGSCDLSIFAALRKKGSIFDYITQLLRQGAVYHQNLPMMRQMREQGLICFNKMDEQKGFHFPSVDDVNGAVMENLAHWMVVDHSVLDEEASMKINYRALFVSLRKLPDSVSVLIPYVYNEVDYSRFWSHVKSINVAKKIMVGMGLTEFEMITHIQEPLVRVRLLEKMVA